MARQDRTSLNVELRAAGVRGVELFLGSRLVLTVSKGGLILRPAGPLAALTADDQVQTAQDTCGGASELKLQGANGTGLSATKMSQRALMISSHAKNQHFVDHCGRSILYAFFRKD
jgi:hypothetical protein